MADVDRCRAYFLEPGTVSQRRYEVLRARFVERASAEEIGARFGLSALTVYAQVRDFKAALDREEPPAFFVKAVRGPKGARKKPRIVEHVRRLRARGYAGSDIHAALGEAGFEVSAALVHQILREQGLSGLCKRRREDIARVRAEIESGRIPGLTEAVPAAPTPPVVAERTRGT